MDYYLDGVLTDSEEEEAAFVTCDSPRGEEGYHQRVLQRIAEQRAVTPWWRLLRRWVLHEDRILEEVEHSIWLEKRAAAEDEEGA